MGEELDHLQLTFLYAAVVVLPTRSLAECMRASPGVTRFLNRVAGVVLIGFGVKLAVSR